MWTIGLISVLVVSAAWSQELGTNRNTSVNSNTTPPSASNEPKIAVSRKTTVNVGSDVILECTNKTWSEMIYTIWNINLNGRHCRIASSNDGHSENLCDDRKALHNTTSGESYLLISSFSKQDEGLYKCETVHKGGSVSIDFHVSVTVPPTLSARLEWEGSRLVAVCSAEGGKPAATITWRNTGNFMSKPTEETQENQDGSYTVTSRLVVPEGVATGNLTCAVGGAVEQTRTIAITRAALVPWVPLLITALLVSIILAFLVVLFFTRKNLILTRPCCWQPSTTTPSGSKSPPAEEVEEVEPYASYVQRVNSIYNSSADLFT